MKKIILLFAITMFMFSSNSYATSNFKSEESIEQMIERMKFEYDMEHPQDYKEGDVLTVNKEKSYVTKTAKLFIKENNKNSFRGTGFFIKDGYIVTAEHIVKKDENFYVQDGSNAKLIKAKLVAKDQQKDIAVLKTEIKDHVYFELSDSEIKQEEEVVFVGNSDHHSTSFFESKGKVTQTYLYTSIGTEKQILSTNYRHVISALMYPGDSGCPIFNKDYEIVGVGVATSQQTHYGIITTLAELKEFLNDNL